ncbi:MAG: glycosyltransferase family 39 protein [Candidatus Hodarchaeota archaeon]
MQVPKRIRLHGISGLPLFDNIQRLWPLLILGAFGLVLRLIKLGISFWYDEGFTGHLTQQSLIELLHFLTQEDIHPPLYFLMLRSWVKLFPTDLGIRLFSVLTGIAAIFVLFSLCRKLFNCRVGWLASAFLVISPFHLRYSQEAKQYSLYVLLTIIALWILITTLESRKYWNVWCLGYSLTLTLILYTHGCGALIVMGLAVFHICLIWPMDRLRFFQWIGLYTLALLLFLPWFPVMLHQAEMATSGVYKYSDWLPPISLRYLLFALESFIYNPPYEGVGLTVNALWMLPHLVLLGSAMLFSNRSLRRKVMALVAFAAVPVAAITVYGYLKYNIFIARTLAPVVIPLLVLAALPIDSFQKVWQRSVIRLITALALVFSFVSSLSYLQAREGTAWRWREAVAEIKQSIEADDGILVLPEKAIYVFNWYFQDGNGTWTVRSLTDVEDLDSHALEFLKGHRRLWIVRDQHLKTNQTLKVVKWFNDKYTIQRNTRFQRVDVVMVML